VCHNNPVWTTRVPLRKKHSLADTLLVHIPLPNLRNPAGTMAPPLLKRQKSIISWLHQSYLVPAQAPPLPIAGEHHNVPQQKASRNQHVPDHQKATLDVLKRFMEAIVFTKTPGPVGSNERYSIVDKAWELAIEAQDRQHTLAGASVDWSCLC